MMRKTWFPKGLTFKCTQCGACCTGPDRAVWINADEAEKLAAALGTQLSSFLRRCVAEPVAQEGKWQLKRGSDGGCVFLTEKRRCSVHSARPVQCRTYPFWPEHLISWLDWNAEAALTCEGMRRVEPGEDATGTHSERAVLKEMLMTDIQRSTDDVSPSELEAYLDDCGSEPLDDYASEFWRQNYRRVRYASEALLVVDTCLDGAFRKRSLIFKSMPSYAQTEVRLESRDGVVRVDHSALLQWPYQAMLLASVPSSPKRRLYGVMGAGGGAFAGYLLHQSHQSGQAARVVAVERDADVLQIGQSWFDFEEIPDRLEIVCRDALTFLLDEADGSYDVLFIDVADDSGIPPPEFGTTDAASLYASKLCRDGVCVVNVASDLEQLRKISRRLRNAFERVEGIYTPHASILVARKFEASEKRTLRDLAAVPGPYLRDVRITVDAYHQRELPFGWLSHEALSGVDVQGT